MRLYSKILVWFFVNLVVLGAGFYLAFRLQFQFGLDSLLMGQAGERIEALSEVIGAELKSTPEASWSEVMKRFGEAYKAQLYLFRGDGSQAAGEKVVLPEKVQAQVGERRGGGFGGGRGPPSGRGMNVRQGMETRPRFVERTAEGYWLGVCLASTDGERGWGRRLTLVAMAKSLHGGGLFFDLRPWVVVGFAALLFSALLWLPLVGGITRAISRVTRVTEEIAEGKFESRVNLQRRDELGRLGLAVNVMAERLAGFVTGQKRFLGDIAHELCSPLARMEVALGILDERADEKQRAYVEDVREEVREMSALVNELLSFSKAGLRLPEVKLVAMKLAELARKVVEREAGEARVRLEMPENLAVLGTPELLGRALKNLVRNAVRYGSGEVEVRGDIKGEEVFLRVADSGPGVPEEELGRIFEPFYRVEGSRSRETGGAGLGLAIVKGCVEACGGRVSARNENGLVVEMRLKVARAETKNQPDPEGHRNQQ